MMNEECSQISPQFPQVRTACPASSVDAVARPQTLTKVYTSTTSTEKGGKEEFKTTRRRCGCDAVQDLANDTDILEPHPAAGLILGTSSCPQRIMTFRGQLSGLCDECGQQWTGMHETAPGSSSTNPGLPSLAGGHSHKVRQ